MPSPKTVEKPLPGIKGMVYIAWSDKVLSNSVKLTDSHVGEKVLLAEEPTNKIGYTLREIRGKKTPSYPQGGYILTCNDYPFGKSVFTDEVILYVPAKKKSNSQLSRKKSKKAV